MKKESTPISCSAGYLRAIDSKAVENRSACTTFPEIRVTLVLLRITFWSSLVNYCIKDQTARREPKWKDLRSWKQLLPILRPKIEDLLFARIDDSALKVSRKSPTTREVTEISRKQLPKGKV